MRTITAAATFVLALGAADAGATVLYKLVEPSGQVTYTDSLPRGWSGPVTRIDIDTSANNVAPAQIPEVLARNAPAPLPVVPRQPASNEERLRFARARVDAARAALADAQNNSTPDDWIYFHSVNPNAGRRAPRPEYEARLQALEGDLLVAEDDLSRMERELR